MAFFNEQFKVSKKDLEAYGAFNCNLQCDTPYNFDPFLLYANSDKEEYGNLVTVNSAISYSYSQFC